ncbi:MAG: NADH-quinone oxidoreductase subunit D [Mangrovibacterium sp.]
MAQEFRTDYWKRDLVTTEEPKEYNTLNVGPTHPATHGVFQNVMLMDGEFIVETEQTIGYIHRAFEKIAERRPFYQITPLTDRLNYCSAPLNNMGWHMTVEKLLGIETPKRVDYLRIIVMELARIADHLICNSVIGVDSGALTGFTYLFQDREFIYEIYEEICGSRLTTNMGRIGGFERNFSPKAWDKIRHFLKTYPAKLKEFENMLVRNRIFMDRTVHVGAFPAERALAYGFTGPNLRACGVDYDVRALNSYCSYDEFDFIVPVGQSGDTYDRFMVRQEEMWQSLRIIEQAVVKLDKMDDKETYFAPDPRFVLPPKEKVYNNMEALIWHFKIVMGETDIPEGEVYHSIEAANGELGFYLVSDGGRTPFRLHFRRPCFIYYQAYPEMITGGMLSDAILTMSSMNIIAGELDA